jgi:hypothetical protein
MITLSSKSDDPRLSIPSEKLLGDRLGHSNMARLRVIILVRTNVLDKRATQISGRRTSINLPN